nr:hypothetical protein C31H1.3 - Caenorhabditis elegans [Caenorhabditis elegans]
MSSRYTFLVLQICQLVILLVLDLLVKSSRRLPAKSSLKKSHRRRRRVAKSRQSYTAGSSPIKETHLDPLLESDVASDGERFQPGILLCHSLRQSHPRQVVRGSAPNTDHASTRRRGRYTASGRDAPSPGIISGFLSYKRGDVVDGT